MNKIHTRRTLMGWGKADLVDHCMALEHNVDVLNENFDRQYDNCMKMVKDMEIINKTYKDRNKQQEKPKEIHYDIEAHNVVYTTAKADAIKAAEKNLGRKLTHDEEGIIFHSLMSMTKVIRKREKGARS